MFWTSFFLAFADLIHSIVRTISQRGMEEKRIISVVQYN